MCQASAVLASMYALSKKQAAWSWKHPTCSRPRSSGNCMSVGCAVSGSGSIPFHLKRQLAETQGWEERYVNWRDIQR